MNAAETPQSPPIKDSDLLYLVSKRLDAVALKMTRLEYDDELTQMMAEAVEWFDWLAARYVERETDDEAAAT